MSAGCRIDLRLQWLCSLAVGCCGCIGSFLVDELSYDRDEGRAGFERIAGDEAFVFHAAPGLVTADELRPELNFLHGAVGRYIALAGMSPQMSKVSIYVHGPDAFRDEYLSMQGIAFCDDLSFDMVWDDAGRGRLTRREVMAHEVAHLWACEHVGNNPRVFLNEGLAEYLRSTVAVPRGSAGPHSPAQGFGYLMCESWSLRPLFPNASWLEQRDRLPTYPIAALFTEVAVGRLGLRGFLERYFKPTAFGTSQEAEALSIRELGLSFEAMEQAMRAAAFEVSSLGCSFGCGAECRCQAGSADPFVMARCVPEGMSR